MAADNGFVGTIVSGGPGNPYQVLLNNSQTVTANCVVLADSETIPAGYKVIVVLVGVSPNPQGYYFQCPVWSA